MRCGRKSKMIFYSLKLAHRDNHDIMEAAYMFKEGNRELIANRSQTDRVSRTNNRSLEDMLERNIREFPDCTLSCAKRLAEAVCCVPQAGLNRHVYG